ncbi:MAG: hypothetical protein JW757_06115 [Anaerolineales bacterium]|nr:hypothetical protein [Anaerolineales bacterium]
MEIDQKRLLWANICRWAGRILSIPAILFAIGNLISPDTNMVAEVFWYEWLAVGTLFASVLALVLGWWKEKIGGWAAWVLLVLAIIIYGIYRREFFPAWYLLLAGIGLPAGLFLVSDYLRHQ